MDERERIARLAQLAVSVGANVQPGQPVVVTGTVEHAALMREIGRAAYRAGARYVEPYYSDRHFTRARVELGPEAALDESAPWAVAMIKTLAGEKGALISVHGEYEPHLLSDLDGTRVGKASPKEFFAELLRAINERSINWTIIAGPNPGWAQQVFGKPDVEALWRAVEKAVRLDRDDPVAAWREHIARLQHVAEALTQRHFESLRYRGPGTDLTVGLLPSGRWLSAEFTTAAGVRHVPNLPTEEVFTSPDRGRAEGKLRSTKPLQISGTIVRDLELEFRDGAITTVNASAGADVIRAQLATDEGASRLGEISLVDGSSEVGKLGLVFSDTLFDENATSHIAYGNGFAFCIEDEADRQAGLNVSALHTDFMVGGPEVDIDGRERGGTWVPVMRDHEFQIG